MHTSPLPGRPALVQTKHVLLFICVAVSLAWLLNKNALYDGLEYTVDVFTNLEAARSIFVGDSLFHEYLAGGLKGVHNHFILLLLGPLTLVWGAKAFFAVTALLQARASARIAARADHETWVSVVVVLAAMIFGPLMFWIVDDPVYGWQPEHLYPFLSVLFAEALLRQRKIAWLWAGLIVLCREEGALLVGAIVVVCLVYKRRASMRSILVNYAIWVVVFASSMILLRLLKTSSGETRVGSALHALTLIPKNRALLLDFVTSLTGAIAIFAAGLILLIALGHIRLAIWATLVSLPLWGTTALATIFYADRPEGLQLHGFLWPPRFAIMWSILLAACVFAVSEVQRSRTFVVLGCAVLSILAQAALLSQFRGYSFPARIAALSPTVAHNLTPRSLSSMYCIARGLPRETIVQPHWNLHRIFEKQNIVTDTHQVPDKPAILVCDGQGRLPFPGGACLQQLAEKLPEGYSGSQVDGIIVAAAPGLQPTVAMCLPPESRKR